MAGAVAAHRDWPGYCRKIGGQATRLSDQRSLNLLLSGRWRATVVKGRRREVAADRHRAAATRRPASLSQSLRLH